MKKSLVTLAVMALAGCASVPAASTTPLAQLSRAHPKEDACANYAIGVAYGQSAVNAEMGNDEFQERIAAFMKDPTITAAERPDMLRGLNWGYSNGIYGTDPKVLGVLIYNNCVAGT